jgi:membrane protein implicated in regulation of membrane protease activity
MIWWAWAILGFILLAAELLTPGGFYLLFFGISALVVGLMDLAGIGGPDWLQWIIFSCLSVTLIAFLRKPLVAKLSAQGIGPEGPTVDTDTLVGEIAVAAEGIAPGGIGRVELRGAAWRACNRGAKALISGQRCVVDRIEGLRLDVHPES